MRSVSRRPVWAFAALLPLLAALAACGPARRVPATSAAPVRPLLAQSIVPAPASVQLSAGAGLEIDSGSAVVIAGDAASEVEGVARYLSELLATPGTRTVRRLPAGETPPARSIRLTIDPRHASLGEEGYDLTITADSATLVAREAAGLFHGVQTIRQLLPPSVEHRAARARALRLPAGRIVDAPRFAWRGAMLDVSRHFLGVSDVKRYIDAMALYKLNRLHLHLADDQGWRIEIKSRPRLALHGGSTQVGGGPGGYYTQTEYADLVAFAASRFVTIVPEIDMPGHTNAALASYPELNCDDVAPPLYTEIKVGFSALCVERDTVGRFVDDVVRELAALTPTPYIHVGGDEVEKLTHDQYDRFVERVQRSVQATGKQMIGWGEIATADLLPTTIVQHWRRDSTRVHAARGGRVILSPASRTYLDMKYDSTTVLGLRWAGLIDVRTAYTWEPATQIPGVLESAILGVEAPLWSETLVTLADYEYMAFPRLAAIAEIGWSPASVRDWDAFRLRLAEHGPRLSALGVNFHRSPDVPWLP